VSHLHRGPAAGAGNGAGLLSWTISSLFPSERRDQEGKEAERKVSTREQNEIYNIAKGGYNSEGDGQKNVDRVTSECREELDRGPSTIFLWFFVNRSS